MGSTVATVMFFIILGGRLRLPLPGAAPHAPLHLLEAGHADALNASPGSAVHAILIAYTLIATLPILLVVMNRSKSHDAISARRSPCRTPRPSRSIGYERS